MKKCLILHDFEGWRKLNSYRSQFKSLSRSIGKVSSSNQKDKDNQLQKVVSQYITLANKIEKSILDIIDRISENKKLTNLIEGDLFFL